MYKAKTITKTCGACPAQWVGRTFCDRDIYIRYRWGGFRCEISRVTIFSCNHGDAYCGTMDFDTMTTLLRNVIDFSEVEFDDNPYKD